MTMHADTMKLVYSAPNTSTVRGSNAPHLTPRTLAALRVAGALTGASFNRDRWRACWHDARYLARLVVVARIAPLGALEAARGVAARHGCGIMAAPVGSGDRWRMVYPCRDYRHGRNGAVHPAFIHIPS